MKIVADQKIPHVDVAFGRFGDLLKLESGAINNTMVHDADAPDRQVGNQSRTKLFWPAAKSDLSARQRSALIMSI